MDKNTTTTANGLSLNYGQKHVVTADPNKDSIGYKVILGSNKLNYEQEQKIQRIKELAAEMINTLQNYHDGLTESEAVNDWLYQHAMLDILSAQMKAVKYLTFKY